MVLNLKDSENSERENRMAELFFLIHLETFICCLSDIFLNVFTFSSSFTKGIDTVVKYGFVCVFAFNRNKKHFS